MHDQLDLTKRACFHLCILIKMDGRKLLPLDYVTIFGIFRLGRERQHSDFEMIPPPSMTG